MNRAKSLGLWPGIVRFKRFLYCARRYQAVEGELKYLAVYEMNDASVPKSAAWDKARNTEWTLKMRPQLKDPQIILSKRIY